MPPPAPEDALPEDAPEVPPEDPLPEEAPDPPSPATTVYALPPQESAIAAVREISAARADVLAANQRSIPRL